MQVCGPREPERTVVSMVKSARVVPSGDQAHWAGTAGAPYLGMDILMWLIVGLVAGLLASMIVGGTGYGIIGDIVVGIAGAFVGGSLFRYAGWSTPFSGLAGTIFIAFIGAIVLLVIINLLRGAATRSRRT